MSRRLPEGEDWKDHAMPCPHCDEPVLDEHEHYNEATHVDPGWWECDLADEDNQQLAEEEATR